MEQAELISLTHDIAMGVEERLQGPSIDENDTTGSNAA